MKHPFKKQIGQMTVSAHLGGSPTWFYLSHMEHQENPCEALKFPIMSIDEVRDLHYALGEAIRWYDSHD